MGTCNKVIVQSLQNISEEKNVSRREELMYSSRRLVNLKEGGNMLSYFEVQIPYEAKRRLSNPNL